MTQPRLDTSKDSRAIDTAVKNIVDDGLSVYDIDKEALHQLKAAVCDWIGHDVKIVSLHPETLSDVMTDIGTVGAAIGRRPNAIELVSRLNERLTGLAQHHKPVKANAPSVLVIEWIDPLMGAGHWIPALVNHAGGHNLITQEGDPSPYLDWSEVEDADPDIIVVAPCGFDLDRVQVEMAALENTPQWHGLRAVQSGKVALMDGNRFMNRPSPAIVESAEILHAIFLGDQPKTGDTSWSWWVS